MRPLNLPAIEDLTEEGYVLDSKNPFWQKIEIDHHNASFYIINLDLANKDTAKYSIAMEFSGFKALEKRKVITTDQKITEKWYKLNHNEIVKPRLKIEKQDEISANLKIVYDFNLINDITNNGDMIYLDPFLVKEFDTNPFHAEQRDIPIEFPFEQSFIYSSSIVMPAGYFPDGLPENALYTLPDHVGKFTYQCVTRPNSIQLTVHINMDKRIIPREMYKHMNEFYSLIMEKLGEQIVLKKM